ncbi:MAG: hypothetical protein CML46_04905 [Rhodobacteraceae bacterium]|nr:hypothetical protein [Paracoccaceae bacterium]MBR26272.1 hypothetical protein [Paracoccaceae bacterium]
MRRRLRSGGDAPARTRRGRRSDADRFVAEPDEPHRRLIVAGRGPGDTDGSDRTDFLEHIKT